jgi:hypothetical protein
MGIDLSRRRTSTQAILASVLALSAAAGASAAVAQQPPSARAARETSLNESLSGTRYGPPGHSFVEKGQVTGTLSGTMTAHVETIASNNGQATLTLYLSKGTLSGRAPTHGHIVGPTAYFEGSMTITGGTGSYAHASGSGLRFSGTLDRQNFRVKAQLHGNVRL